jgi:hypothetical protein
MNPPPPGDIRPGFHYEPVRESDRWRVVGADEHWPCRMKLGVREMCRAPAVIILYRAHDRRRGVSWQAWPYCADHAYGRWVSDGQVMYWQAVRDG